MKVYYNPSEGVAPYDNVHAVCRWAFTPKFLEDKTTEGSLALNLRLSPARSAALASKEVDERYNTRNIPNLTIPGPETRTIRHLVSYEAHQLHVLSRGAALDSETLSNQQPGGALLLLPTHVRKLMVDDILCWIPPAHCTACFHLRTTSTGERHLLAERNLDASLKSWSGN